MKVNKERLEKDIAYAIGRGIWNGEEVDITTKAIMDIIEPLINYTEHGTITQENDEPTKGSIKGTGDTHI